MKKIISIILLISSSLFAQNLKPLNTYTMENLLMDDHASHLVLQGCVSFYLAITELTKTKYPELANEFHTFANTVYPYGIISLSKIKNISFEEAEKTFLIETKILTNEYINEMNENGKKNGSYFKGSFLANDLSFCYDVTRYLQLTITESLDE